MNNRIIIDKVNITKNKIEYEYNVEGEWQEAFNLDKSFFIEYSMDIREVPQSVAVVPLLANLLPMAWVYDAEIVCPSCDKAFYESIPEFKQGYIDMHPAISFGGKLTVDKIEENHSVTKGKTGAFFSGGVDAFNTLVCHEKEKPVLITLWGADVKLTDTKGWEKVSAHIGSVANDFGLDFIKVKSSFRLILKEDVLDNKVKHGVDMWWHGFQHGLAIICHAAPACYVLGIDTLYIASSFHISQKGQYACASDPTIDNFVKFIDADVIHDGYELTRQDKVHNITKFSKETGKSIEMRVCWISSGGANCCKCEKCFRTITAIYAEGCNPRDYGFIYSEDELSQLSRYMRSFNGDKFAIGFYVDIKKAMNKNLSYKELPRPIRWVYFANPNKDYYKNMLIFLNKIRNKIKSFLR